MNFDTNWEKIYNCIATIARFVKNEAKDQDYTNFDSSEITPPDSFMCLDVLLDKQLNGVLYDFTGTISIDETNIVSVSNMIITATEELMKRRNLQEIFIFLQILDKALANNILEEAWKEELGDYQYLNTNVDETEIGILPYFHCGWEQWSERKNRTHDINVFVDNYLIIDLSNLKDLQVIHYYLEPIISLYAKQIRVGVSPLWDWKNFDFQKEVEKGIKVINISYNSECIKETSIIYSTIEEAAKQKVDILVFPEMHGNPIMKESIRKRMLAVRSEYPKLVVLPSYWDHGENKASVINRYGLTVIEQGKRTSFVDKDGYHENLKPYDELNVMHIRGFGRILVMICRDFLEVKKLQVILDEIRPTMVLIPSFSTGFHDFDSVKGVGEAHECVMVWVNSCADSKAGNPIAFVDRAGHSYAEGNDRVVSFYSCKLSEEKQEICNHCCDTKICLYTVDLINPKAMEGGNEYARENDN